MIKKTLCLLMTSLVSPSCTAEALPGPGLQPVWAEWTAQGYRISLNAESVPFEHLLRELTRQCRISIANRETAPLLHQVSIRFSGLPLEQAIRKLFKAAGIYNYLIRYSAQEGPSSHITGIIILSRNGDPETIEPLIQPPEAPEQPAVSTFPHPPDQFSAKLTSFKERYRWESDAMLNRALYLLDAMPDEVKSSGLDGIIRELDRTSGPGRTAEIGEELFFRAIEAAAPPGMAPLMIRQVRRLSEQHKNGGAGSGPENFYEAFDQGQPAQEGR